MAIKVYGDKIVYPDNSEQTTAFTGEVNKDVYTKEQIDAQQSAQDVKIDKNYDDIISLETKTDNNLAYIADNTTDIAKNTADIATKVPEAPEDDETYARNNGTWVSISDSSGIPDAPVDGLMYGRKDGDWNTVADAGDVYTKTETNDLLDEKADKTTTYTKTEVDDSQDAQDVLIQANTDAIADLPAPVDAYTKAESDAIDNAQDVEIAKKANTSDTYTKDATDTLLDTKANVGDSYLKAETYNTTEIDGKLFEKADTATTYTKTEVDDSQDAQDTNISSNTTAIGTLSGQVSQNSEDIAELQDSIFFSSAYSADYPASPNRDPNTGNMYLQNFAMFTYAYAEATQIFCSKTDESGNVRQFTAVKAGDSIVLNQVDSPNYGRYELVSVEDVGDYVMMVVDPKLAEGTIIEGVKVAFQAFPKPATDSIWTEVDGNAIYDGNVGVGGTPADFGGTNLHVKSDNVASVLAEGNGRVTQILANESAGCVVGARSNHDLKIITNDQTRMTVASNGGVSTTQDITVNGVRVGMGGGSSAQPASTAIGLDVLASNVTGSSNTGIGANALRRNTSGFNNLAVGTEALNTVTEGSYNTAIGSNSGTTLTTGSGNIVIGYNAQPSSPDVSNEVTIGNDDVSKLRMGNGCVIGGEDSLKNTVLGIDAYQNNSVGMFSTAVGHSALKNSNYAYNTALGYNAGSNLTDGGGNVCIGYESQASSPTATNEVTIGSDSITLTRLQGKVHMKGAGSWSTSGSASPNVYVDSATGELIKTTTTFYSTEEVDKKLAIKDKLIEKLSARLDELEKRVK